MWPSPCLVTTPSLVLLLQTAAVAPFLLVPPWVHSFPLDVASLLKFALAPDPCNSITSDQETVFTNRDDDIVGEMCQKTVRIQSNVCSVR